MKKLDYRDAAERLNDFIEFSKQERVKIIIDNVIKKLVDIIYRIILLIQEIKTRLEGFPTWKEIDNVKQLECK